MSESTSSRRIRSAQVGRPPLPPHKVRSRSITVHFTATEFNRLDELARTCGLHRAAFVRLITLSKKRSLPSITPVEFRKAWIDLGRLQESFHQVVKHLNSKSFDLDTTDLVSRIGGISDAVDSLRIALLSRRLKPAEESIPEVQK